MRENFQVESDEKKSRNRKTWKASGPHTFDNERLFRRGAMPNVCGVFNGSGDGGAGVRRARRGLGQLRPSVRPDGSARCVSAPRRTTHAGRGAGHETPPRPPAPDRRSARPRATPPRRLRAAAGAGRPRAPLGCLRCLRVRIEPRSRYATWPLSCHNTRGDTPRNTSAFASGSRIGPLFAGGYLCLLSREFTAERVFFFRRTCQNGVRE